MGNGLGFNKRLFQRRKTGVVVTLVDEEAFAGNRRPLRLKKRV